MFSQKKKNNNNNKATATKFLLRSIVFLQIPHRDKSNYLVRKSVDWFLYNRQTLQGKGLIVTSIILFIKVGFSPLVVLYTSVSSVIMFLMWMVVLLSSSMSLSRFKFGSFYILYRELFFGFDSFCFVVLYYKTSRQGNSS